MKRDLATMDNRGYRRVYGISFLVFIVCLNVFASFSAAAGESGGKSLALCIGVGRYDEHPMVSNAINDATNLARIFEASGDFRRVFTLADLAVDGQPNRPEMLPNRDNILKILQLLGNNVTREGGLLVYFNGRCVMNDKRAFLLPSDAPAEDAEHISGIPLASIIDIMARSHAATKMLVIDGYHGGELSLDEDGSLGELGDEFTIIAVFSGDQISFADDSSARGVFSLALAAAFTGEADADMDGVFDVEEVLGFSERFIGDYCLDNLLVSVPMPRKWGGKAEQTLLGRYVAVEPVTISVAPIVEPVEEEVEASVPLAEKSELDETIAYSTVDDSPVIEETGQGNASSAAESIHVETDFTPAKSADDLPLVEDGEDPSEQTAAAEESAPLAATTDDSGGPAPAKPESASAITDMTEQEIAVRLAEAAGLAANGNAEAAFNAYLPLAQKGVTEAEYLVGDAYQFGRGVEQDYAKSLEWLIRAGNKGYLKAQELLTTIYYFGRGVPVDSREAGQWSLLKGRVPGDTSSPPPAQGQDEAEKRVEYVEPPLQGQQPQPQQYQQYQQSPQRRQYYQNEPTPAQKTGQALKRFFLGY